MHRVVITAITATAIEVECCGHQSLSRKIIMTSYTPAAVCLCVGVDVHEPNCHYSVQIGEMFECSTVMLAKRGQHLSYWEGLFLSGAALMGLSKSHANKCPSLWLSITTTQKQSAHRTIVELKQTSSSAGEMHVNELQSTVCVCAHGKAFNEKRKGEGPKMPPTPPHAPPPNTHTRTGIKNAHSLIAVPARMCAIIDFHVNLPNLRVITAIFPRVLWLR